MSKLVKFGAGGVKNVKEIYVGAGGVKKVKAGYIGAGGVKQFISSDFELFNYGSGYKFTANSQYNSYGIDSTSLYTNNVSKVYEDEGYFFTGYEMPASLDNFNNFVITAKSGNASYTTHYIQCMFQFKNTSGSGIAKRLYISDSSARTIPTTLTSLYDSITSTQKTNYKNFYNTYGAPRFVCVVFVAAMPDEDGGTYYTLRPLNIYQLLLS